MNFYDIFPIHIAVAMKKDTPIEAVTLLAGVAGINTPKRLISASNMIWAATGLPVRHGLIMAWLAEEHAA